MSDPAPEPETRTRVCCRVEDNPLMGLEILTVVRGACRECDLPVWVQADQVMPPEVEGMIESLICDQCALSDPVIGPSYRAGRMQAALRMILFGQTTVWNVPDPPSASEPEPEHPASDPPAM